MVIAKNFLLGAEYAPFGFLLPFYLNFREICKGPPLDIFSTYFWPSPHTCFPLQTSLSSDVNGKGICFICDQRYIY